MGWGWGNIHGAHMLLNIRTLKQRYAATADASWELVNGPTASVGRRLRLRRFLQPPGAFSWSPGPLAHVLGVGGPTLWLCAFLRGATC